MNEVLHSGEPLHISSLPDFDRLCVTWFDPPRAQSVSKSKALALPILHVRRPIKLTRVLYGGRICSWWRTKC
jgi:hypothetical protein